MGNDYNLKLVTHARVNWKCKASSITQMNINDLFPSADMKWNELNVPVE
jgi:hypothetical protein